MTSPQTFEEFCQQKVDEGIQKGAQHVLQLVKLASQRLARPLDTDELDGLSVQIVELGLEQTAERLRELSPKQLQRWLRGAEPSPRPRAGRQRRKHSTSASS